MKMIDDILGYDLVETCSMMPEQYDVFKGGKQVGYLRLRNGCFIAECPEVGGFTVYYANPDGDGEFEDHERLYFLTKAVMSIKEWYDMDSAK